MKNLLKKIALTLTLLLSFNTIPTFALTNNSDEIIIFEEEITLTPEQINELKALQKTQKMNRSFSTDHSTYIQRSVSKQEAIAIKNTYNKLTNALTYGGLGIWGGEKVANISKLSKYANARAFIRKSGNWASNIINILTFVSVISINRFTSQIQSALDKMNNRDRLIFRIDSHDLQDSNGARFSIKIQRR